jgi:hypothetical protein
MKEKTRVMSASNASAIMSNITVACSSQESGMPTGATGIVISVVACFSAR